MDWIHWFLRDRILRILLKYLSIQMFIVTTGNDELVIDVVLFTFESFFQVYF